jgi:hypothetical protein
VVLVPDGELAAAEVGRAGWELLPVASRDLKARCAAGLDHDSDQ